MSGIAAVLREPWPLLSPPDPCHCLSSLQFAGRLKWCEEYLPDAQPQFANAHWVSEHSLVHWKVLSCQGQSLYLTGFASGANLTKTLTGTRMWESQGLTRCLKMEVW